MFIFHFIMNSWKFREIKEINTCKHHYVSNEKWFFATIRECFKVGFYGQNVNTSMQVANKQQTDINNLSNNRKGKVNKSFWNNTKYSFQNDAAKNSKTYGNYQEKQPMIIGILLAILFWIFWFIFKWWPLYFILKKLLKNR